MKPEMCLVLLITTLMVVVSTVFAQSRCTNAIISMAPCLDYITQNTSSPSQQCCNQLANVVQSSSECLCEVLAGGGSQIGINLNETQALALPKACHVQTPPASRCNGGSSDNSHAGSSNTSEHGTGSKAVPGENDLSPGNSIKFSFPLIAILFAASSIIIFAKH